MLSYRKLTPLWFTHTKAHHQSQHIAVKIVNYISVLWWPCLWWLCSVSVTIRRCKIITLANSVSGWFHYQLIRCYSSQNVMHKLKWLQSNIQIAIKTISQSLLHNNVQLENPSLFRATGQILALSKGDLLNGLRIINKLGFT